VSDDVRRRIIEQAKARQGMVSADLRAYAEDRARHYGTPVEMFKRQIETESGFNPAAFNAGSGATGIAQIIPRWHPGVDATDPYASLDYAAKWMADLRRIYGSWAKALAAYNWGPANVAKWDGKRETLPAETRHYLDVILGEGWPEPDVADMQKNGVLPLSSMLAFQPLRVTEDGVRLRSGPGTDSRILATLKAGAEATPLTDHAWRQVNVGGQAGWIASDYLAMQSDAKPEQSIRTFDPETPTYYQRQDWTCSIGSVIWMLRSVGIDVTPEEAQDAMVPAYVNERLGLLDGSGAGIVEVLRERWGVTARTLDRPGGPTFDDVLALAGRMPVAIGGRNWGGPGKGHWSAVRGRYEDALILANPARGVTYGQTTLTRQDWQRLGGFSAVVVDL